MTRAVNANPNAKVSKRYVFMVNSNGLAVFVATQLGRY
jgi:hypothetical protein